MDRRNQTDMVKEIIINILLFVVYYIYCFIMILIVHFFLYRVIKLGWTMPGMMITSGVGAAFMIIWHIVRKIKKGYEGSN